MIRMILGGIGIWAFGNLVWILGLVNIAWMLFKDYTLFSWWYVFGSLILTIVSLVIYFWGVVDR